MDKEEALEQFCTDVVTAFCTQKPCSSLVLEKRRWYLEGTQELETGRPDQVLVSITSDVQTKIQLHLCLLHHMDCCLDELIMMPGDPRLPLNDQHVLFLPTQHRVILTAKEPCTLTLVLGHLTPRVSWLGNRNTIHQVLKQDYVLATLSSMVCLSTKRLVPLYDWNETDTKFYKEERKIFIGDLRIQAKAAAARRIENAYVAHIRTRQRAVEVIQKGWRFAIACPYHHLCRRRLMHEFAVLTSTTTRPPGHPVDRA